METWGFTCLFHNLYFKPVAYTHNGTCTRVHDGSWLYVCMEGDVLAQILYILSKANACLFSLTQCVCLCTQYVPSNNSEPHSGTLLLEVVTALHTVGNV